MILKGKKILISGLLNHNSIAYGIAKSLLFHGAELALTYKNNKLKPRIEKYASILNTNIFIKCDVSKDHDINKLFNTLSNKWNVFDGFIHSIAYAPKDQLNGNYLNVITKSGFNIAHNISSYSFVAMAKASKHMLRKNSSLITISYIGSKKAIPNYNVMGLAKASLESNTRYMAYALGSSGIRVNTISSGPIKTISSYNIKNFRKIQKSFKCHVPIKRLVTIEDIGNTAAFLCSNMSSGITGEVIHVDGGFHII
ncbi:MAG: enoyl-ACP reductase [Enterobacterales bacterium]